MIKTLASVLPKSARINEKDHLEIGGCDVVDLADEYGTPLFIYDEKTLIANCREYRKSFAGGPAPVEVVFAGKAFMSLATCRLIAEEGLSIDVSSGGELFVALRSGFAPEKIFFHGNNKTEAELEMALAANVGNIVVDSFDELALVDKLAGRAGRRQDIFLRLTPGIKPQTHKYIQTGQVDSKFGFGLSDGLALEAVRRALRAQNSRLVGLHAHIGSQIFALDSYAKTIEVLAAFISELKEKTGFLPDKLNLGGGLGIHYKGNDRPSSIPAYAAALFAAAGEYFARFDLPLPTLAIEPGRSIVGNACVTLYRVGTVKRVAGGRTYISVDGGMSDNLRPMLYGAGYEALAADKMSAPAVETVTVAGKHCESGDVLIDEIPLPDMAIGEVICTPVTGAYGYAMANNFNMQPRPAVVLVGDGSARVIIRRESYEDLIRLHDE